MTDVAIEVVLALLLNLPQEQSIRCRYAEYRIIRAAKLLVPRCQSFQRCA